MLPKKFILVALFILPAISYAQWPLKVIGNDTYNYIVPDQILLSKVKYTSKGNYCILFNWIVAPQYDNISIHGDDGSPSNYKNGQNLGIFIISNPSGISYNGNGNEQIRIFGSWSEYGVDFETDANDNFIVLGNNVGNAWNGSSPASGTATDSTQILLCKSDLKNKIIWYKLYGGSSAEYAVSIKKSGDGNFIVLAQTESNDGDVKNYLGGKDIWLFKIDGNGNMLWQKTLGSNKDEIPTDLEILEGGSIVISGSADQSTFAPSSYSGKNAFLLKLNATGDIIWTKVFGGNGDDKIKSFTPTGDGFVSIGTSTSADGDYPLNAGKNDICIFKHDSNGAIIWKKQYGNSDDDQAGDIVYSVCDNKIFASYAKQFSQNKQYISNPPYPLFSQNAGIQIGLLNSDGSQVFYHEDDFGYSSYFDNYYFNDYIYTTMAPNNRGGFLAGGLQHWRYGSTGGSGSLEFLVRRSFHVEEYGIPLNKSNYDTALCAGQSAWGIVFEKDSTFSDTLRNACNVDTLINTYTVKVAVNKDSIITRDTTICYGQFFNGVAVTASFTKSDTLKFVTACGFDRVITRQSITVPPLINISLGNDTTACREGLPLTVSVPGATYLWQNGTTNGSLLATNSGLYWVQATDNHGCKKRDSINISITNLYLGTLRDTTIAAHKTVLLLPQTNGNVNWQYNNALSCQVCAGVVATPSATTTFYMSAEKDGCFLNGDVTVTVLKEFYFYLPNAFTPNNDGKNDVFKPTASGITEYKMQVFNRWSQVVFQTENLLLGWDGKYHGKLQPGGAYVYLIKYKNDKGQEFKVNGSLLLVQ